MSIVKKLHFHRERKGWACLHLAARNGQPEKARLLLERGASVNETQDQGWNALHLAVRLAFVLHCVQYRNG